MRLSALDNQHTDTANGRQRISIQSRVQAPLNPLSEPARRALPQKKMPVVVEAQHVIGCLACLGFLGPNLIEPKVNKSGGKA